VPQTWVLGLNVCAVLERVRMNALVGANAFNSSLRGCAEPPSGCGTFKPVLVALLSLTPLSLPHLSCLPAGCGCVSALVWVLFCLGACRLEVSPACILVLCLGSVLGAGVGLGYCSCTCTWVHLHSVLRAVPAGGACLLPPWATCRHSPGLLPAPLPPCSWSLFLMPPACCLCLPAFVSTIWVLVSVSACRCRFSGCRPRRVPLLNAFQERLPWLGAVGCPACWVPWVGQTFQPGSAFPPFLPVVLCGPLTCLGACCVLPGCLWVGAFWSAWVGAVLGAVCRCVRWVRCGGCRCVVRSGFSLQIRWLFLFCLGGCLCRWVGGLGACLPGYLFCNYWVPAAWVPAGCRLDLDFLLGFLLPGWFPAACRHWTCCGWVRVRARWTSLPCGWVRWVPFQTEPSRRVPRVGPARFQTLGAFLPGVLLGAVEVFCLCLLQSPLLHSPCLGTTSNILHSVVLPQTCLHFTILEVARGAWVLPRCLNAFNALGAGQTRASAYNAPRSALEHQTAGGR